MKKGNIVQIIGPVVDVEFSDGGQLPEIFNALKISGPNGEVTLEVVKHLDANRVRAISLQTTDGLMRGLDAQDTGKQIEVPVGQEVLGNIFNVLGKTLNKESGGPTSTGFKKHWPIHRPAPPFTEQSTKTEVFETGIKVIDLICPILKGGKVGLFGGAGVGKTVVLM